MSEAATRDDLIEILETMLEGQVRALRGLRDGPRREKRPPGRRAKKSNTDIVEDVLIAAGGPLHVNEIISLARREHGRQLSRESIVSALSKKVLDRRTFRRTGRNEFDLLEREGRP